MGESLLRVGEGWVTYACLRTHRVRGSERRYEGWASSYSNALTGVSRGWINSMLRGGGEEEGKARSELGRQTGAM